MLKALFPIIDTAMINIQKHASNNITCLVCWCLIPLSTNMYISYNVAFSLIDGGLNRRTQRKPQTHVMIDIHVPHPCLVRLSSVHTHHEFMLIVALLLILFALTYCFLSFTSALVYVLCYLIVLYSMYFAI